MHLFNHFRVLSRPYGSVRAMCLKHNIPYNTVKKWINGSRYPSVDRLDLELRKMGFRLVIEPNIPRRGYQDE